MTAADVSSQDDSIPRIMSDFSVIVCKVNKKRGKLDILRWVFLMAGLEGIYRMAKLTRIVALSWKVRAWVSLSEKYLIL